MHGRTTLINQFSRKARVRASVHPTRCWAALYSTGLVFYFVCNVIDTATINYLKPHRLKIHYVSVHT